MITNGGPRNSAPGTLNHLFFEASKAPAPEKAGDKPATEKPVAQASSDAT